MSEVADLVLGAHLDRAGVLALGDLAGCGDQTLNRADDLARDNKGEPHRKEQPDEEGPADRPAKLLVGGQVGVARVKSQISANRNAVGRGERADGALVVGFVQGEMDARVRAVARSHAKAAKGLAESTAGLVGHNGSGRNIGQP